MKWDSPRHVLQETGRRQLALELWPEGTARGAQASGIRTREIAGAQVDPRSDCQLAGSLTRDSADSTKLGEASGEALAAVGFAPDGAISGEHSSEMATVSGSADCVGGRRAA